MPPAGGEPPSRQAPPTFRSPVVGRAWAHLERIALTALRRGQEGEPRPVLIARVLLRLDAVWRRPCGFIYRIAPRGGDPAVCKVGFSVDPPGRLRQLQTGCPLDLVLEETHPGRPEAEQAIHEALRHCRVRGEWFATGPEVDAAMRALAMLAAEVGTMPVRGPRRSREPCGETLDLFAGLKTA